MTPLIVNAAKVSVCETCGGEGTVIEFRRFAGEYQAGEPVEVPCPDCDGDEESPAPREPYVPSAGYAEWCAQIDEQLTQTISDPLLGKKRVWR